MAEQITYLGMNSLKTLVDIIKACFNDAKLEDNKLIFYYDDEVITEVDLSKFAIDGMVTSVEITTGTGENNNKDVLKVTWNGANNTPTSPTEIPLEKIFNPNNYYNKEAIDKILYGEGGASNDVKGGLLKDINDTKSDISDLQSSVDALEKKLGTSSGDDSDKTIGEKAEDAYNEIYGDGDSSEPGTGSILDRLDVLESREDVVHTEITASEILRLFNSEN